MMVLVMMLMLMVVVTAAVAVLIMMVVMVMLNFLHQFISQRTAALHGRENLLSGKKIPGSGQNGCLLIVLAQHGHSRIELALLHFLCAGEQNGAGVFHLIIEEFTEILHINLALYGVYYGDKAVQLQFDTRILYTLHGGNHIGQLAHAGRLDDDAVGGVGIQHFLQCGTEITHQRAADTAGVHFGDLHAGALQKAAVNTDLTEFVFNQDDLFLFECLIQKLFD